MKRLLALTLLSLAAPQAAQAASWNLVGYLTWKAPNGTPFSNMAPVSFILPMESEVQCEIAGSKLEISAKQGKFDQNRAHKFAFECIKGK